MKTHILISLLNNAVLLLAMATVYDLLTARDPVRKAVRFRPVLTGIALGCLGIGLMLASVCLVPGIIFDTRSILLSVSGLFFGLVPTLIAMAMTAAFRISQGGAAAWPGATVIIATGSLGLLWRYLRRKPLEHIKAGELYVFGIINHIVMLACMLLLPPETARHVLTQISLPVLVIYPLGTAALGGLLAGRLRRERTAAALADSEKMYRHLFHNRHTVMLLINPESGDIIDANPAACRFYGWSRDEFFGMNISQIDTLPLEKIRETLKFDQRSELHELRFRHRLADGSLHDVEMLCSPVTIGEQNLLHSVIHDITERNQKETERNRLLTEAEQSRGALLSVVEDLKQTESKLQLTQFALDHSADPAFWVDSKGRFTYVNEAACLSLGYTREEFLRLSVRDINPDFPAERWASQWQKLKESRSLVFESRQKTKDGRIFSVEIHDTFMKFHDTEYICASAHNITQRKQLHDALEKRILALTRPLDEGGEIAFEELFDIKEIQRIQDEFAAATGVTSAIFLPDGTEVTEVSDTSHLCRHIIRMTEKGCANCAKSDKVLGKSFNPNEPTIMRCLSAGLWDGCVRIMLGGRHIANWNLGQVRDETHTEEQALQYAREIGADEQKFMEAFRTLPVMSGEHFKQIAQALSTLANQLSTSAYQNIQQARFIADEQRRTEELRRLSTAIGQSPEAVVITDPDGIIQYVNPAFEHITGYSAQEAFGKKPSILKSGQHDAPFYSNLWKTISEGKVWEGRFINKRKSGELYTEEASISPVKNPSGIITGYVAVKRDITDELLKEEQYRQSQKMEAVGQLAGGIAHDFNNILQAILGFSEILLTRLETDSVEHRNAAEIQKASKRAAELVQQLLAFSRKQPVERKQIDLNAELRDAEVLLQILLGKNISHRLDLAGNLLPIYADHGQITQIIMNLAVNARDAMTEGGRLTLATENITFEPQAVTAMPEAEPGSFVCLSVTDTGCGMSREVRDHLFEPFFTTKAVGQGTGLGLAVVYGIVKQNKGWIHVYSEEGQGSTFKIYLPSCGAAAGGNKPGNAEHNGRILLVEDDPEMRQLVIRILETSGYDLVTASGAEEAFQLFEKEKGLFDLLFSDIVLPGKNGIELADTLRGKNPALPVLLYSGYQDQRERWENLDTKGYHFLKKPFSVTGLLSAVHDAITEPVQRSRTR